MGTSPHGPSPGLLRLGLDQPHLAQFIALACDIDIAQRCQQAQAAAAIRRGPWRWNLAVGDDGFLIASASRLPPCLMSIAQTRAALLRCQATCVPCNLSRSSSPIGHSCASSSSDMRCLCPGVTLALRSVRTRSRQSLPRVARSPSSCINPTRREYFSTVSAISLANASACPGIRCMRRACAAVCR